MTSEEIRKTCMEGSAAYLQWLTENKKGENVVNVREIKAVDDSPGFFKQQ